VCKQNSLWNQIICLAHVLIKIIKEYFPFVICLFKKLSCWYLSHPSLIKIAVAIWKKDPKTKTQIIVCHNSYDHELILPNFPSSLTHNFFVCFAIKLCNFIGNAFFPFVTSMQAFQQKSEKEEKQILVGARIR